MALRRSVRLAFCLLAAIAIWGVGPARAAVPALRGTVVAADGTPVGAATVTIFDSRVHESVRSDASGAFIFQDLRSGPYVIRAAADGYATTRAQSIEITPANTTVVQLVLSRSTSSLTMVGDVTVNGHGGISTSSAPTSDINAQTYAARGYPRVSDVLESTLGLSLIRPAGGNPAAPAVAALRGPDPTETLVDIDGHQVNNANSGDFDLSLLDPADFSTIQVVYGIAPSSLVGPNTIGGAINMRTLEPTVQPHGLVRATAGSYGTLGGTLQATGTDDRLGYAFSLHRMSTQGQNSGTTITTADGVVQTVGSAIDGTAGLVKLRYTAGRNATVALTVRDQSLYKDESAALSSTSLDDPQTFTSFAGSAVFGHASTYGLDVQLPLGGIQSDGTVHTTALFRHFTSLQSQSVTGPASNSSPYFLDDRDVLQDDSMELDRVFQRAMLTAKFDLRGERLSTQIPSAPPTDQSWLRAPAVGRMDAADAGPPSIPLAQTQRSVVVRLMADPTPKLHYTAGAYYSWFDSFGTSFDPRLGVVWTPTSASAVRFSAGTTFQSPQLTELYVPSVLPDPDAAGHIDIGNPNLKADHATEYDIGYDHLFGSGAHRTHAAIDLYRTNLRTPSQRYIPAATCGPDDPNTPPSACLSYPINVGAAVYQGFELRIDANLSAHLVAHAGYSLNGAYPLDVPASVQNGTLVAGQQFLGLPLHKATFSLEGNALKNLSYSAGLVYEGTNNELNRSPFATVNAALTWQSPAVTVILSGTNLTNVYDDRFTIAGGGLPYPGAFGPIPTDAYALPGRAITLSIARKY